MKGEDELNSITNIEVSGTLLPFEEPVQSHHSSSTNHGTHYVVKQVYRGELLKTNEVSEPGLLCLGILLVIMGFTVKQIRRFSKVNK